MIIFGYIAYFILTTANALYRRFVIKRKNAPGLEQVNFAFEVMLVLFSASMLMQFFSPLYFGGDKVSLVLLSLACGVFGMVYFTLNFIAQKHVDAGVSNILININTPIIIILSSVFLHEGLSNLQIVGTVLLLISIFLISKKHRTGRFSFDKYFWLMSLSGIFMGGLLVAERALQIQTGLTGATMLSWGSQCVFLGLATLVLKSKHTYTYREVFLTGIFQVGSSMSYVVLLFVVGNLSLVSSILTFKIVVIFIGAAIFLHEREDLGRKVWGSIIAVIGLLLMK